MNKCKVYSTEQNQEAEGIIVDERVLLPAMRLDNMEPAYVEDGQCYYPPYYAAPFTRRLTEMLGSSFAPFSCVCSLAEVSGWDGEDYQDDDWLESMAQYGRYIVDADKDLYAQSEKWGYCDVRTGRIEIKPYFQKCFDFYENEYAVVKWDDGYGVINDSGWANIAPWFAEIRIVNPKATIALVKKRNNKWGVLDIENVDLYWDNSFWIRCEWDDIEWDGLGYFETVTKTKAGQNQYSLRSRNYDSIAGDLTEKPERYDSPFGLARQNSYRESEEVASFRIICRDGKYGLVRDEPMYDAYSELLLEAAHSYEYVLDAAKKADMDCEIQYYAGIMSTTPRNLPATAGCVGGGWDSVPEDIRNDVRNRMADAGVEQPETAADIKDNWYSSSLFRQRFSDNKTFPEDADAELYTFCDGGASSMKITVHRAKQIGGCITEIESKNKTRIIIDVGANLPGTEGEDVAVERLTENCAGVFITHYHGDHIGEYRRVAPGTDVYMGKTSKEIFSILQTRLSKSSAFTGVTAEDAALVQSFKTFSHRESVRLGDLTITPIRADHSAFDSYMFLISDGEKRVLHTGDFRTHGWTGGSGIGLLGKYAGKIDCLICEGTMLSRPSKAVYSERDLYEDARNIMCANRNVFVLCSSTNIDTISSFYRAANAVRRRVVADSYQRSILHTVTKQSKLRLYKLPYVSIYFHDRTKLLEEMSRKGFCMFIRATPFFEEALSHFPDSIIIYSQWEGYRDKGESYANQNLIDFLDKAEKNGSKITPLHTSGHAYEESIIDLCNLVRPRKIFPIHGENSGRFEELKAEGVISGEINRGESLEV